MKNFKVGDTIYFMLDGHPHAKGSGIVTKGLDDSDQYEVKLITNCKEYKVGTPIYVSPNEIVWQEYKKLNKRV